MFASWTAVCATSSVRKRLAEVGVTGGGGSSIGCVSCAAPPVRSAHARASELRGRVRDHTMRTTHAVVSKLSEEKRRGRWADLPRQAEGGAHAVDADEVLDKAREAGAALVHTHRLRKESASVSLTNLHIKHLSLSYNPPIQASMQPSI